MSAEYRQGYTDGVRATVEQFAKIIPVPADVLERFFVGLEKIRLEYDPEPAPDPRDKCADCGTDGPHHCQGVPE